ncbi:retrovirus-related pol polyprotein from transposon TNT 1-94, partial [Tanacetum coccineum]
VMNIVMHADSVSINVLPADNKCLVDDNLKSERLIHENDHLFKLLLSQDIVHICVKSLSTLTNYAKMEKDYIDEYSENLILEAELAKRNTWFKGKILMNLSLSNQNAPEILEFFKINKWQAKLDAKDISIANLRKHIESLKGKDVVEKDATLNKAKVIAPEMFKLDLEPLSPKELVEHARELRPLDSNLDSSYKYVQRIQEVLVYVTATCPSLTKPSEKLVAITPLNKNKKVRWKPIGRTFSIVGKTCPLTRITSTKVVLLKKNTSKSVTTPNPEIKIYRRKTKVANSVYLSSKPSCPNCSLSKASKNKFWLWHRRLSHLNFDSITALAKQGLVCGLPKLNFQKDHLCSVCALGKSKKHTYKPKAKDSIQEKLYLLHIDLCGPMRIQIIMEYIVKNKLKGAHFRA